MEGHRIVLYCWRSGSVSSIGFLRVCLVFRSALCWIGPIERGVMQVRGYGELQVMHLAEVLLFSHPYAIRHIIIAGDLFKGHSAQLMRRLSELRALPHAIMRVLSGSHDQALDVRAMHGTRQYIRFCANASNATQYSGKQKGPAFYISGMRAQM